VADRAKAEAAARLVAKQKAGKSSLVIDIKPWDDEAGPPHRHVHVRCVGAAGGLGSGSKAQYKRPPPVCGA